MQVTPIKPQITNRYNQNKNYCKTGCKQSYDNSLAFKAGNVSRNFRKNIPNIKEWLSFIWLRNFTIREYHHLSKRQINNINQMINIARKEGKLSYNFDNCLQYHDFMATGVKNALDKKYGCGNYVVIPIGRSLSSVGKCLGYKIGENNVKPFPMSRARRFGHCTVPQEDCSPLRKYLASIGLSEKEVKTSGKYYIFTDFCFSGESLNGAQKLLKSDKMYGDLDNLIFLDIFSNDILAGIDEGMIIEGKYLTKKDFIKNIFFMLNDEKFKPYSLVSRCEELQNTKEAVIKPQNYTREVKYFYFKLLDNEMKKQAVLK